MSENVLTCSRVTSQQLGDTVQSLVRNGVLDEEDGFSTDGDITSPCPVWLNWRVGLSRMRPRDSTIRSSSRTR